MNTTNVKIIPFTVPILVSPSTRILIIAPKSTHKIPNTNPNKFPKAKSSPTADPSPTGNTNSHPSSSMIGTSGIKKKEL
jgi:hypothetical protein